MKRVLITGASGFLGRALCKEFLEGDFELHLLDKKVHQLPGAIIHELDLTDSVSIAELSRIQFDFIYHLGAIAGISDSRESPFETIQTNILGTTHFLELIRNQKHGRFVFASSVYVHSEQGSIYAASKRCCELLIEKYSQEYNIEYSILRFGSIYGPNSNHFNFISATIQKAIANEKIVYNGTGNEKREYIHVKDAARLAYEVMDIQFKNEILKITGSQRISIRELFEIISESIGREVPVTFSQNKNKDHYSQTPYNYLPRVSNRIVPTKEIDLSGGVYDVLISILKDDTAKS